LSVTTVDTAKKLIKDSDQKVEKTLVQPGISLWSERFGKLTEALTDSDKPRHIDEHPRSDLSPNVIICQTSPHLDFETRNTGGCKLDEVGAWRYAAHPATEILTLSYRHNASEPRLWHPLDRFDPPLKMFAALTHSNSSALVISSWRFRN
jgi:hypothetical protein